MPKIRLTDAAISRLKPPGTGQVEYYDLAVSGFGLRISHKGARSFFIMKRVDGRMRRTTLGRYPALALSEARRKAGELVVQIAAGKDPRETERIEQEAADRARQSTVAVLVEEFLSSHVASLRPRTQAEYWRVLRGAMLDDIAQMPINEVTSDHIRKIVQNMRTAGEGHGARTLFAYLQSWLNWVVAEGHIPYSPTAQVSKPRGAAARDRFLTREEIVDLWQALSDNKETFGLLIKCMLLTGQRRSEVAGMKWSELDHLDGLEPIWRIPGARTKNKLPHLVPLAHPVAALLLGQPQIGEFVFTTNGSSPMSGFSRAKRRINGRIDEIRTENNRPAMAPWRLHDLRRTTVTMMNEDLHVAPHVVEAVVNHVSGLAKAGVAGTYNRAIYLDDRRRALDGWSRLIVALVGGREQTTANQPYPNRRVVMED